MLQEKKWKTILEFGVPAGHNEKGHGNSVEEQENSFTFRDNECQDI